MGATEWSYYVPYQEDVGKAVQELRQKVFDDGAYYDPYAVYEQVVQRRGHPSLWEQFKQSLGIKPAPAKNSEELDDPKYYWQFMQRIGQKPPPAKSIEELYTWKAYEVAGTHSILDILEGVSPEQGIYVISPLPQEALITVFGTLNPTRQSISAAQERDELIFSRTLDDYEFLRFSGFYFTVYDEDGNPDELFIYGYSGD